jgi:hypothetical protein
MRPKGRAMSEPAPAIAERGASERECVLREPSDGFEGGACECERVREQSVGQCASGPGTRRGGQCAFRLREEGIRQSEGLLRRRTALTDGDANRFFFFFLFFLFPAVAGGSGKNRIESSIFAL